jgi:hypothetical protein
MASLDNFITEVGGRGLSATRGSAPGGTFPRYGLRGDHDVSGIARLRASSNRLGDYFDGYGVTQDLSVCVA